VLADRDSDPKSLIIENQSGNKTYMAQAEWIFKPHRRLDVKLSYRYIFSQMYLAGENRVQTMQSPHRMLTVINYQTRQKWYFDLITQVNSPKRLPLTSNNPENLKMPSFSPWYTIINFQLRKAFKNWEFYLGSENILNILQKNPVLSASNPNSPYFDAAFAWGPTMGRNFYAGFRWQLK
jgi:outer membrane receptor protein involved in Fe transport